MGLKDFFKREKKHIHAWRIAKREDFPRTDYPAQFVWDTGRVIWCDGCKSWRLF